jgi:hypothetical protein
MQDMRQVVIQDPGRRLETWWRHVTSVPTITEFLEARIAEDEARAGSGWARLGDTRWETDNYGRDFLTPSAVLAECAAKRAILDVQHQHVHGGEHGDAVFCDECQWDHGDDSPRIDNQPVEGFGTHPCRTLALVTAAYAGHPDYHLEWAPRG